MTTTEKQGLNGNLAALLAQPEGKTLEFKRDLSSPKNVLRTLVAFANTAGGTIVVGVDDDGSPIGLADAREDEERLASLIADGIAPVLLPDLEIHHHAGVDLLVVRVARFPGPFHVKALGEAEGVFVRLGSTNRRADSEKQREMRREIGGAAFDQLPCLGADADDLDLALCRRVFDRVGREVDRAKLESLGLLVRYGKMVVPSNAGMILFGRDGARQRLFPGAQVRCARFAGPEKVEFLDSLDIDGTVLEAIDEVPKFIRRNTRMAARIRSMVRENVPEFPAVSLREGLINAIAHTDYSEAGMAIRVVVFSNRIEIENPGTFPLGLTVDDFKRGVSRIRNLTIARVFRELGLMETWGSGYKRIREDCEAGGYPIPAWEEVGPTVRVRFEPHPEVVSTDTTAGFLPTRVGINVGTNVGTNAAKQESSRLRQDWFFEQVQAGRAVSRADLVVRFDVTLRTAERDIEALRTAGRIEFEGAKKTGRYRVVEPSGE